ncbi:AAA family ATPase [Sphingomonas sp. LHG3443-2]|uniref:AAA family ATPase n=1 Tax=Sphingomonas sp. LHG3443-2 TaxID=2804639 RepID=UPI003CEF47F7
MRFNPFQPNKIVNPGMFVGRLDEILKIERYLYQAKLGNPQNFFIEGERGIGKSSLLHYVSLIAKGRIAIPDGHRFNFLLIAADAGGVSKQTDLVRAIARELKSVLAKSQAVKESLKGVFNFLTDWEILGVRYHKDKEAFDPDEAKDLLVDQLVEVADDQSLGYDGVIILLDEADAPSSDAGLGEFLKTVSERLVRRGCDKVAFGLAGLPIAIPKMRESHESSPRMFTILHLAPLEVEERKQAIRIGIEVANEKNEQKVTITEGALASLAELSEGYPHFVQQFSYSAFEVSTDDVLDEDDVKTGAYEENGAIEQLGKKYFSEAYFGKINSDDYRKVLNSMARYSDSWVSRKQLIHDTRLKESTINNALQSLKQKNIILVDESRQGFYRLPTKSFAAWINALRSVDPNEAVSAEPRIRGL